MEYAVVAWNPHQCNNIQTLEKIQCRDARWVMNDYNRYSTELATSPILSYNLIVDSRCFYAAVPNTAALSIPQRFLPTSYPTRNNHQYHYIIPSARTNAYQTSFYPRTIKDWNQLPTHII